MFSTKPHDRYVRTGILKFIGNYSWCECKIWKEDDGMFEPIQGPSVHSGITSEGSVVLCYGFALLAIQSKVL